jgi:PiT family inorganic phosphate transporter
LWALFPALRYVFTPLNRRCACAEASSVPVAVTASLAGNIANQARSLGPILVVDHLENCSARPKIMGGIALGDGLHWLSSGLTSFARGLNDAPKIVAVGLMLAMALRLDSAFLFVVVALAMGLGSALAGQRVTKTLAERITAMSPVEGLSANLITSVLVTFASRWGIPVSTTHVSTGAITGIGLRRERGSVQWNTVWAMLQAWMITLPVSAGVAAVSWWIFNGGGRG